MLSIVDPSRPIGRRELLRIGSLALGGLSLGHWLRAQTALGSDFSLVRDKSIVFLFMQGGPSQFETFDPKMTAPSGIHSATGEVATTIPGVTFGGTFPKLARLAHRMSIVRSFVTGDGRHDIKPVVRKDLMQASLGAVYARVAGITHPTRGLPSSATLYPSLVDPDVNEPFVKFGNHSDPGLLGAGYAPFVPGTGPMSDDMRLQLSPERFEDRRLLLQKLDRLNRRIDSDGTLAGMDRFQEQAFTTILGSVADVFDLSSEDPSIVARYDTAPLIQDSQISERWKNRPRYITHARTLGKLMLYARRLCEAGVGFVTVTTDFVWDNHADANNAGSEEGMRYCGLPFDHAVSTFLEDVEERGLSDKILLVCCGEMGRTPKINNRGGRDHWGNLAPLMLSGGGLPMGRVIGQSTRDGGEPQSEPVTMDHLVGTLAHTVFDVGQLRLASSIPGELVRALTQNAPIPGLA